MISVFNPVSEQSSIFKRFESDKLDVSAEIQTLIDSYRASLIELINARIAKLIALLSIVLVSAIGYLVFSVYQPIFAVGMII